MSNDSEVRTYLYPEDLSPDVVEDEPHLVGHVGDVAGLIGGVGAQETEVQLFRHLLLALNDLLLNPGLKIRFT